MVIFGKSEVTQGATSDLENVTSIAREMVTSFGFSKLGPISLDPNGSEVFLGRGLFQRRSLLAEATSKAIDEQVRYFANLALNQAICILKSNRSTMDKLVESLIEQETIDGETFLDIAGLNKNK